MKCCANDAFGECTSEKIEGFLVTKSKAMPLCRYHSKGMSVWTKEELRERIRLIEEAEA